MTQKKVLVILLTIVCSTNAANILGLFAFPSRSHHIWNRSLMLALAARGHKVTVLVSEEAKNPGPNYMQYVIPAIEIGEDDFDINSVSNLSPFDLADMFTEMNVMMCEPTLQAEGIRNILKLSNTTTFDLIIAEVTGLECILGLVHAFNNPPLIGVTAYSHPLWISYMTGNPHNPSYVPMLGSAFNDHMTFWQRLYNTAYHLYTMYKFEWSYLPRANAIVRKYLGDDVPSIRSILNNISLVMVNTFAGFDYPRPLVPAVVEVGGMHVGPSKPLPQHLKTPMDKAKQGFIYFSLGSAIRSDKMSPDRRQIFLDAFSKLPYTVFWKWESDSLPGQPSNVILGKWMPQRDILAHPNILLFITHNGLLSTQEAIYSGVPMIGVPFFADQGVNAAKSKSLGIGESIDLGTATTDQILELINKVVNDQRYRENVRRLSKIMKDQPQTPLERAVFWAEYVIRHKGAPHLRSAAVDMPWYQYLLLDVVCVLAMGVLVVLSLIYKTCSVVVALATRSGKSGKQKQQ